MDRRRQRIQRVADAISKPQRDQLADEIAVFINAKGPPADERCAIKEAIAQLAAEGRIVAPDPQAIDVAIRPPLTLGQLWAAILSIAFSTALAFQFYLWTPRFKDVFNTVDVPMPAMSVLAVRLSDLAHSGWGLLLLAAMIGEACLTVWLVGRGWLWLGIRTLATVVLYTILILALWEPLMALFEGIGRQK